MKSLLTNLHPQNNSNNTQNHPFLNKSLASKKHEYAIQSIPYQIDHRKSAFKNYFNSTSTAASNKLETEAAIVNQKEEKNAKTRANNKLLSNSYHNNKTTLPKIIKFMGQRRMAYFFNNMSEKERNESFIVENEVEISAEENFIEIKSMLIYPREQSMQVSCSWPNSVHKKRSFPILNKLLLTDGKDILRNCISKENRFPKPKQCQDRPFSILNKC